jgi:hypothetical protein
MDNTEQADTLTFYIHTKFLFHGAIAYSKPGPPHYRGFTITLRYTKLGRAVDELSTRLRDLYLTTHNTHNRQTSMPPAGFEHAIPASKRQQAHALDRADTGTNIISIIKRVY